MCFCNVCCSISHVQRVDAGQYHCRLSLGNTTIESPAVVIQVEGETQHTHRPVLPINLLDPGSKTDSYQSTSQWRMEFTIWLIQKKKCTYCHILKQSHERSIFPLYSKTKAHFRHRSVDCQQYRSAIEAMDSLIHRCGFSQVCQRSSDIRRT